MSYKIAVATSNELYVDLHFGAAKFFSIYEVQDNGEFSFLEKRDYDESREGESIDGKPVKTAGCHGSGSGCEQGGCSGGASAKVELISDVRAVIAEKIGFNVTKQLEKKAISSFDVDCSVQEALEKITKYFYSVDNHQRFGR
ncbi:NifB/NifX family molybdenum-iron cluster-binding protein [Treponema sp.]|uniref:NifB/NifX family molybdenum-iron cluster-binding protein n=1 Tax=Treponema sp. TaxID=166 RepID=UPI00388FCA45